MGTQLRDESEQSLVKFLCDLRYGFDVHWNQAGLALPSFGKKLSKA